MTTVGRFRFLRDISSAFILARGAEHWRRNLAALCVIHYTTKTCHGGRLKGSGSGKPAA
jgi:hypothetical protein